MINSLLGTVSFVLAVYLSAVVFAANSPKRKYFWLLLPAACIALCALRFGVDTLIGHICFKVLHVESWVYTLLRTINCFFVLVLSCAGVKLLYKCSIWAAMYCGSLGYCIQYVGRKIYDVIILAASLNVSKAAETCIVLAITALLMLCVWFVMKNKMRNMEAIRYNKKLIVLVIIITVCLVFIDGFASHSWDMGRLRTYLAAFAMMYAVTILMVDYIFFIYKQYQNRAVFLEQLIQQERERYAVEKSIIDTLNIKCHDLKHQINALDGKLPKEEISNIKRAVEAYDCVFSTRNDALNVVLTTKSMVCENKGITFTCMADGEKLSFMSDNDIFLLFGNLLDNAIEACEKIEDREKRNITLVIKRNQGCVMIQEMNYFTGVLSIKDNAIETTKPDKLYHGFGLSSMKLLVAKYNGEIRFSSKEDMFIADIVFLERTEKTE